MFCFCFFFKYTATTEIYTYGHTLSLHDALPIWGHFIFGAEYVDDKGVLDRNSRRNLGSAGIVRVNPLSPTDLSVQRVRDVNYGYQSVGGLMPDGNEIGRAHV